MSYSATCHKVMIASPGDVVAERNLIREVLHDWNTVNSEQRKIVLMPVGWETHTTPEMGGKPQAIINRQILSGCDILVGVFWTRLGTPTDEYLSGSVEEIEEQIAAGKETMLYFSGAPVVLDSVDAKQYAALTEFKDSCRSRGLYESYNDIADFRTKFYRHIQIKMNTDKYAVDKTSINSAQVEEPISDYIPRLSKEAATLLKDASVSSDGTIMLLHHMNGAVLQANGKNYIDEGSPRSQAIWEGALEELENNNLVKAANAKRNMFRLTREGFENAEILNP